MEGGVRRWGENWGGWGCRVYRVSWGDLVGGGFIFVVRGGGGKEEKEDRDLGVLG